MEHGFVVFDFLRPANQHAAESIHPTVCSLHDPSARLESGSAFHGLHFFAARTDVVRHVELIRRLARLVIVIALVEAQVLRLTRRWLRSLDGNARDRLAQQFEVIHVRPGHGQSDADPAAIAQQASLGAAFGPIRGIRPGFSPRPAVTWSSRHQHSANPNNEGRSPDFAYDTRRQARLSAAALSGRSPLHGWLRHDLTQFARAGFTHERPRLAA